MRGGRSRVRKDRTLGEFCRQLHLDPISDADRPQVGGVAAQVLNISMGAEE